MEKLMQRFDPLVTIPDWDSTKNNFDDLTEVNDWDGPMIGDFFGGEDNSCGNFDHWDIDRQKPRGNFYLPLLMNVVSKVRYSSNYPSIRGIESSKVHNGGHLYIGGDMNSPFSPKDPLLYLHHCNIDRIWALWQINNANVFPQYDATRLSTENEYDAIGIDDLLYLPPYLYYLGFSTVRSVLDHRALGYRYAHDQQMADEYQNKFAGQPAMVWGDPDAFTIAPQMIEAKTERGSWKIFPFQLINDTDFSVEIKIDRFPANAQGQVDGFVWFLLNTTLGPQDSHEHFVVFAPQLSTLYNFDMKVNVDPVGTGAAREIIVPVIEDSTI